VIDMSSWAQLTADVMDDLHLDPHNVRLEGVANAPEADIMADLFHNEKALALVEGIVKVGYLTHEVPIVIRRNRKLVVVEGNRRLAALKAIQNPYLVPDYQARIAALAAQIPDRGQLRKIDVKRAPNQAAADQLIAALHTGNTRVAWTPARQAAFFQAQVDQGKTLKQLKAQYPTVEVEKFMLRSSIMNLLKSVNYSRPELADMLASRTFPTSVLARIYESRDFIELTGIRLDAEGELQLGVPRDVFARMAENIMEGVAEGDINTRSVNKVGSPRFLALMQELRDIAASRAPSKSTAEAQSGRGAVSSTATAASAAGGKSNGHSAGPSAGTHSTAGADASAPGSSHSTGTGDGKTAKSRQYLDTSQLAVPTGYPAAVEKTLQELSLINIQRLPNATFDLMRTFLEKSIKAYADAVSEDIRKTTNQSGYVYLKQCLEWLEKRATANGPKHLVQVIKKLQSNKINDYISSMDHLNAINHNHHIFATTDDVRQSWDLMLSVLVEVLKP
jgi:hypothetical protein